MGVFWFKAQLLFLLWLSLNSALALGSLEFSVCGLQTEHFGQPCPDACVNVVVPEIYWDCEFVLFRAEMADLKTEVLIEPRKRHLDSYKAKNNHTKVSHRKSFMLCEINAGVKSQKQFNITLSCKSTRNCPIQNYDLILPQHFAFLSILSNRNLGNLNFLRYTNTPTAARRPSSMMTSTGTQITAEGSRGRRDTGEIITHQVDRWSFSATCHIFFIQEIGQI